MCIRDRGRIEVGAVADLIVVNPDLEFTVGENEAGNAGIGYRCGWSPY